LKIPVVTIFPAWGTAFGGDTLTDSSRMVIPPLCQMLRSLDASGIDGDSGTLGGAPSPRGTCRLTRAGR
jgi:hypothetical protein